MMTRRREGLPFERRRRTWPKVLVSRHGDGALSNEFGRQQSAAFNEHARYEMTPSFSPDGLSIVFAGDREGHGLEIFQLDFRNPSNEKLLAARRLHDVAPAYSPDGRKMAFISTSDGNGEIYVMNSDGTGLFRIYEIQLS